MWRWRGRTDEDFREEIQANIAVDILYAYIDPRVRFS